MEFLARDEFSPTRTYEDERGKHRAFSIFGDIMEFRDGPQAMLLEHDTHPDSGEVVMAKPHFHRVRQYQVVVRGEQARMGKHDSPPISVHYSDPSTPYGPIFAGEDGITWFTLRPAADVGAYWMPGAGDKMTGRAGRNLTVVVPPAELPRAGSEQADVIEAYDDGLATVSLRLGPGAEATGPSPAETGGQYYMVIAGTILDGGRELSRLALGWVGPEEEPAVITAGDEGAEVLVLQFPVHNAALEIVDPTDTTPTFTAPKT